MPSLVCLVHSFFQHAWKSRNEKCFVCNFSFHLFFLFVAVAVVAVVVCVLNSNKTYWTRVAFEQHEQLMQHMFVWDQSKQGQAMPQDRRDTRRTSRDRYAVAARRKNERGTRNSKKIYPVDKCMYKCAVQYNVIYSFNIISYTLRLNIIAYYTIIYNFIP